MPITLLLPKQISVKARSFNGNLSSWNPASAIDMAAMFGRCTSFNSDLSNWNMSSVKNLDAMFQDATNFNSDISSWDVGSVWNFPLVLLLSFMCKHSNVTSRWGFWSMFMGATSFNIDLSAWNISGESSMEFMFQNATSFNQNLCSWKERFPYDDAADIFEGSACTNTTTPQKIQQGPFCASNC